MLLTVHDSKMNRVAFLDNTKEKTLNYYEDLWVEDLVKVINTFDFTIDKKELESDTVNKKVYQVLSERSFISFNFMGRKMLFNVMDMKERGDKIKVFCEDLNLELLNEKVGPYEATTKMSFVDYCVALNILNFGAITIGTNEIKDYERTLKWTGTSNKHQRLISIANQFDAEIEFRTYLNKNSGFKSLVMNVYKKNDGKNNHGVGKRRDDVILINDHNIDDVERTIGKEQIKTMITPTGRKTVDVVVSKPNPKYVAPTARTVTYSGGGLIYSGRSISKENVQALLNYCTQYNLLPSGVLAQLFVESYWGKSTVGQVDNNWGGMTWTGSTTRPSGVTVSRGMARPAAEGGYYNHYASVADYFKDYTYLFSEQGIYKVKGKDNLEAFTLGLFRKGGALYDYAAIGYDKYIYSMKDVRYNVNRLNNNALDTLDDLFRSKGTVGTAPVANIAKQTKAVLNELAGLKGQRVGSGQCYALSAWFSNRLGGAGLGGGVTGFRGLIGAGAAASNIGEDYNWEQFGWKYVIPSKTEHLIAGSILNIKANFNAGFIITGPWGHTVIVKSIVGDTLTVYEQNFAGHQYVEERTYSASQYLQAVKTAVYPKEIVQGKRVEATANTTLATNPIVESGNAEPKTISETQQQEKVTTIDPTIYREWKDANGEVEFYLKNGSIYAPKAKELYPAVLSGEEVEDDWLLELIELETDDQEILISESLEALKKICYPSITYDVDAFEPKLNAGDTVKVVDRKFHPTLTLEARVTRQERSFTSPSKNKTKFENFRALESKIPKSLQDRYEELSEMAKPYDLRLSTTSGQMFKNGVGTSVITAELWKNNKKYDATYQFKNIDTLLSSGLSYTVNANEISENFVITIEAYVGNDFITSKQLTFANVNDGVDGIDGLDGPQGLPGPSGTSSYTHIAYSNASDGSIGFSVDDGLNKSYIGVYVDSIQADSTDPTKYTWTLIKGAKGDQGIPGPVGADGKTPYFHTAYATSPDGKTGFSISDSSGKSFLGTYTDFIQEDSTDPLKYTWTLIKGEQGPKGADGLSTYTHVAYANKSTDVLVDAMTTFAVPASFSGSTLTSTKISGGYKFTSTGGNSYTKQVVGFSGTTGKNVYTYLVIKNTHATNDIVVSFNGIGAVLNENFSNVTIKPGQTYVDYRPAICRDTYNFLQISIGSTAISNDLSYEIYDYALYNTNPFINFSLDVNPNFRFRGEYQDNNQTASTDPTKYKWSDLRGTVDVGGRNYLTKSNPIRDTGANKLNALSVRDAETPNGFKVTGNQTKDGTIRIYNVINSDGWWTVSFDIKGSQSLAVNVDVDICDQGVTKVLTNSTNTYERKSVSVNVTNYSKNPSVYHFVDFANFAFAYFWIDNIKIEKGNIATDHSEAPEDTQTKIDSKADQALTQEQLNALSEQASIAKAELQAKASIDTLNQWITSYQNYVASNNADSQQAKADLIAWSQKVEALGTQMGEVKETKIFMDTYFSQSSEGLVIGQTDGTSNILIKEDRISMFSAGNEVMYISQGVLNINNGIFALSIQLGRFREEQYAGNKDINVIRYVGGV
ncbi:glucosaminidase domain-containing protein [Streptococcus uberis]|nr:glucosaminidase domain-containing protein [Streptococcus uberis]MCK1200579.1 glucosaminidase domain-containing protein [Streptococcus uberis]